MHLFGNRCNNWKIIICRKFCAAPIPSVWNGRLLEVARGLAAFNQIFQPIALGLKSYHFNFKYLTFLLVLCLDSMERPGI